MQILKKILTDKLHRKQLVKEFQQQIWNGTISHEILSELAYDLDFYEPNEALRKESLSYYDDVELEKLINNTLQKLEK
jgi:hypothetical protein